LERGEISDEDGFINLINTKISPDIGEKIMTFTERVEARGELKSKLEIAERLKAEGMDLSFIAKITGLPTEQIQGLQV